MILSRSQKIVLAHKGFFNSAAKRQYRENSLKVCKISNKKEYVKIIELDIRKSKDGVLYCYHGNLWDYLIGLKIPKTFSKIKNKYQADTLRKILNVVDSDKTILLDIKDTSITREDVLNLFEKNNFKEVILANKSVSYLDRFNNMPRNFAKLMNVNIFCNFYDLHKLKEKGYRYFEVLFPFQARKKVITRVRKNGLEFWCIGFFFFSKKRYFETLKKYSINQISSDYIE